MKTEGYIGAEMEFAGLPQLWLESSYNNGWIFKGGTRESQELNIKKVWEELVQGPPLPIDLNLILSNINFEIQLGNSDETGARDYELNLNASATIDFKPTEDFESQLRFESISFKYNKSGTDESKTSIALSLKGNANLNDEIIVTDFSLDYNYSYNAYKKTTEWNIDGTLYLLAFQRLMAFKAHAAVLENSQKIGFSFESSQPIMHAAYFNKIINTSASDILTALNGGTPPANNQLPIALLAPDYLEKLGPDYTQEQKNEIALIIESAKRANEDLVTIPDILNENKPLCSVSPRKFLLNLARENGKFKSLDFAIGADLTVFNTWNNQSEIISIKNGLVSTGFDLVNKSFYLKFETEKTEIKPLSAIAMLPGVMPMLINAFNETPESHPKTSAFVNLLEIHPLGFTFVKQDKNWQINGSLRLVLNNGLKTLDENLYNFLESIFPKTGDQRFIGGQLGYDSTEGLVFVLENNNGFEVPNFLATATSFINPQFKADFKERTSIDLDQALNLGTSFIILDRVRLKIAKDIKLDMRVGIGLPSNLNDRFFNPASKIHGLINTYNREKFVNANVKPSGPVQYETPLPNDGLLRASLSIGTDGISGQLDRFNVFNLEKIAEEFKGFLTEDVNGVTLDFKALTNNPDKQYAKIKFDKIVFAVDFKKCTFNIKLGAQLLSNELSLPLRPLLKKLIGILPPDKFDVNALNTTTDLFGDSITLKSLSFYDSATGNLNINGLLDFLKQFLLETHRNSDVFPKELTDVINSNLAEASKFLPTMLLEYLAVKLPAGFNFNLEVTADQSVSFSIEVPEPTPEQKAAGYAGYLQTLFPNPPLHISGIRLKKLGFGSALFNNAFRLDLSAELMAIGLPELIPGIGYSLARKLNPTDERLQFMLPDTQLLGNSMKIENLLMFIFPQTQIPIPVPVFYDKFSIYSASPAGAISEMNIGFPRPTLNITELLKALGDLVNFFKNKEFALPVSNYGTVRQNGQTAHDSIFPAFNAGPFYFDLPGILGYEKKENGSRKKIQLGFKDSISLNSKELASLALNTAKFGIMSLAEKKYNPIKINETKSEYPVNYVVKFLPESQRIGSKKFVLFEVLEANYVWAISTPGEFKDVVWPLIKQEQARSSVSGPGDTWVANELLAIVPGSDKWSSDQDGLVILLKGGVKITDNFIIDAVSVSSLTSGNGLATGMAMRSKLAGIFDMELAGGIQINPGNSENTFGLAGKAHLKILNMITVMKGNFSLYAGTKSEFKFNGVLDLFPDELFGGNRSPVQLYTGTAKGTKSDFTGIIANSEINIGHYNPDGSISGAGIHLELWEFYLSGTTRVVSTATKQEWEIKLMCYDAQLTLQALFNKTDAGNEMYFAVRANQAIGIENILTISGTSPGTGVSGYLKILQPHNSQHPTLTEFYLDGEIALFGLRSATRINIRQNGFDASLKNNFGILQNDLTISGRNFNNSSDFQLNGSVNILSGALIIELALAFQKENNTAIFKGSGSFKMWGSKLLNLALETGNRDGNFFFNGIACVDLSLPGILKLYTGTAAGPQNISGIINHEKLDFNGALYFAIGPIEAAGSLGLTVESSKGFYVGGSLKFNAVILSGGFNISISKSGDILSLSGNASESITILPGVLLLNADASINLKINEASSTLELFQLKGNTSIFGINTTCDVYIGPSNFEFHVLVNLAIADLSFKAQTHDMLNPNTLKLSGNLSIDKINKAIDDFFVAIDVLGILGTKRSNTNSGITALTGTKEEIRIKREKIGFIQWMDSIWTKNGIDPHGFQYCVPPVSHVDYWSDSRGQWDFGRPRYSKEDLRNVERYYQYKRDLGLDASEPVRGDIKRFVEGVLSAVNDKLFDISKEMSATFRKVINDIHHFVTDGILAGLNIDTSDLDALNSSFNEGLSRLDAEVAKLNALITRITNNNNKLIEVSSISFSDQAVDLLSTKKFTATVNHKVLGEAGSTTIYLNLDDIPGSIIGNLKQFLPVEIQRMF